MDFLHQTMSFLYGIVFAVLATFGINIGTEACNLKSSNNLGILRKFANTLLD